MDEIIRNAWVAAGKSLQESSAIASLKLIDTPSKVRILIYDISIFCHTIYYLMVVKFISGNQKAF